MIHIHFLHHHLQVAMEVTLVRTFPGEGFPKDIPTHNGIVIPVPGTIQVGVEILEVDTMSFRMIEGSERKGDSKTNGVRFTGLAIKWREVILPGLFDH